MTMPLFETDTYSVDKATIKLKLDIHPEGTGCYSITNKETDVLEAETTCLPDAMFTAIRFEEKLFELRNPPKAGKNVPEIQYNAGEIILN